MLGVGSSSSFQHSEQILTPDSPIRKEVVDAVLTVLPKEEKAGYEHLNKRDQKKIQNNLLEAFAGNPEAVRYYTISMAASIY